MPQSTRPLVKAVICILILLVFLAGAYLTITLIQTRSTIQYWPTDGWRQSTPEAQGIDSEKLAAGLLAIRETGMDIHSLLIVRNGYLIMDAYFYPYDGSTPHELASVTKSVTTTVVAIAASQNKLSLNQPMVSFFPDTQIANLDSQKRSITVRDLAAMSSGLACTAEHDEATLMEMTASPDYILYALELPVAEEPGTRFVYCSPNMHILSAIIQRSTGMTELEYARQNLFSPLGISEVIWPADPQGVTHGWGNIYLYPRDAAKLGYIWLNHGMWDGKQIVPNDWVQDSVKPQHNVDEEDDYGYGWWVRTHAEPLVYEARGRGGQRVSVIPDYNLIAVFSGGGFEPGDAAAFITPALVDMQRPLPDNQAGTAKLQSALAEIREPTAPTTVSPLPPDASAISGVTYSFQPNPLHVSTLTITFNKSYEAFLDLTFSDSQPPRSGPVGLDGVYRFSPGKNGFPVGMRGYWNDSIFNLEYDQIANREAFDLALTLNNSNLLLSAKERTHEATVELTAQPDEADSKNK